MDHDPNHSAPCERSGDQVVADRLADEAARLDIGTPVVEVVIQRGRQRQQRRRTAVGVLSVAGVCATAIVTVNVLSRPADQRAVTAPGETVLPANGTESAYTPARLVESNLTWSRYEPESAAAVSFLNGSAELTGDGPFVAWSTAPGVNSGKASLWRSDDGLSWQQLDNVPIFSSASVVQHNGRFLALGTAPATASANSGSVEAIASSADGGITWDTQTLDLDTSDLEDEPGVASVTLHASSIAAGPAGVMAVVRQSVNIDWENLLTPAQLAGYIPTQSGVQIFDPNQCGDGPFIGPNETVVGEAIVTETTATGRECTLSTVPVASTIVDPVATALVPSEPATTLTWAELGVSEKAAAAFRSEQVRMFFSADGATFDEVQSPVVDSGNVDLRLTDTDDGFVASVVTYDNSGTASNELFHTTDGQSWTAMGPAPLAFAEGFAALGDRLVMSSWVPDPTKPRSSTTTAIAVRDPNGTWTTTLLNDLLLPSDGVVTSLSGGGLAVGPDGITMLAMLQVDPIAEMGGVEVTRNGITMRADALNASRSFLDESGAELGSIGQDGSITALVTIDQQTGTYQVRRTEEGEVVATFSEDDVYSQLPVDASFPTTFVLHSADGVAWSRESISDLAGAPISGTGGIRVTDSQIIVAANLADQKNADGTPKQVLLLGTPKT